MRLADRATTEEKIMKRIAIYTFLTLTFMAVTSSTLFAQTRIMFARGATSATVSNTINGYGSRTYVLGARYGQVLSANVSSRSGCVTFSNRVSSESYITEPGSNYLTVVNRCGGPVSFALTVSINFGSD